MTKLIIKHNEVHLWYQDLRAPQLQALTEDQIGLLNLREFEKFSNFKSASKKIEYWATRVLVRTVLSKYLPIHFADFKFSENSHGRPEIEFPKLNPPLRFNVSHCEGLLVCAVGLDCELGIDIEETKETNDLTNIAKRHFTVSEFQDFKKCDSKNQTQRFYEYWTLKEAYTKARGMGLSTSLQDFGFELNSMDSINLLADCLYDRNFKNWRFKLHRPTEKHQMALAVRQSEIVDFVFIERWNLLPEKN